MIELSNADIESVSGGNPIVVSFLVGAAASYFLEGSIEAGADMVKSYVDSYEDWDHGVNAEDMPDNYGFGTW